MNTGSNAQAYETHVPLPAPVTGTPRPRRTRAHHRTARLVQPDATIVENCRVLNTVFANQVEVQVRLANRGILSSFGKLKVEITDPATQQVITSMVIAVQIGSGETCNITRILSASDANVWSFDQQTMYQLVVNWQADRSEHPTASRRLDFAFRQFAGEGRRPRRDVSSAQSKGEA